MYLYPNIYPKYVPIWAQIWIYLYQNDFQTTFWWNWNSNMAAKTKWLTLVDLWPKYEFTCDQFPKFCPIYCQFDGKTLVFSGVLGENALLILKFAYPSWSAGLLSRLKLIKQFLEQFSLFWHKFLEHKVQFFLNFTLSLGRSWSKDSTLWFSACPDHKLTLF